MNVGLKICSVRTMVFKKNLLGLNLALFIYIYPSLAVKDTVNLNYYDWII